MYRDITDAIAIILRKENLKITFETKLTFSPECKIPPYLSPLHNVNICNRQITDTN